EADARGQPRREKRRDACEDVRDEKDRAERLRLYAEPEIEPVGREALDDEAAAEGVDGEQRGQLRDHPSRLIEAGQIRERPARGLLLTTRRDFGGAGHLRKQP